MKKRYAILKDSPEVKEGTVFVWDIERNSYVVEGSDITETIYSKSTVEEQPEWFEEVAYLHIPLRKIKEIKKKLGLK